MSRRKASEASTREAQRRNQRGFTLLQMIVTVAIVLIVSGFAAIRIASAREQARVQGAARDIATRLERARIDAIRRHGTSTFTINSATSYSITMDFGGMVATRAFPLPQGIRFSNDPLPGPVTFDFRGRTGANTNLTLQSTGGLLTGGGGMTVAIGITAAGDITANSPVFLVPADNVSNVPPGAGIIASNIPPTSPPPAPPTTPPPPPPPPADTYPPPPPPSDNYPPPPPPPPDGYPPPPPPPDGYPPPPPPPPTTPPPPPPPPPTGTSCTMSVSPVTPPNLQIRKGGASATITATISGAASTASNTVTASTGASNLTITPSSHNVTGNGTASFTVRTVGQTRGTDLKVTISSPCGAKAVLIDVTN